ncbi:MAG: biotin/lipoyl-binding protein [Propionibacteriaceae bacterium]|jgi:methylmalonyl-CoA carboxyltransferase small subunit|nr:biotin/lipoyl-binding protein [Propionibacteriaceae bacterium]
MRLKITVDAVPYEVDVEVAPPQLALPAITIGGSSAAAATAAPSGSPAPAAAAPSGKAVPAPLAGTVNRVLVEVGQTVEEGDIVLILEAMKMETEIAAPANGQVKQILVAPGDPVQGGQSLIEIG